jgi:hypothetical protein
MVVDLSSFPDIGLIIKAPTGVYYTSQTGGFACEHPQVEGFFVPIRTPVGRSEVAALWGRFRGNWHPLDEAQADALDALLGRFGVQSVRVDRSMLKESKEAWVHIVLTGNVEAVPLDASTPLKGVFIWPNSD